MAESVWLVVPRGVYYKACVLAARSLDEAQRFCDEWAPDRDGYHGWEIIEMRLGAVVPDEPAYSQYDMNVRVPWEEQGQGLDEWRRNRIAPMPDRKQIKIVRWEDA